MPYVFFFMLALAMPLSLAAQTLSVSPTRIEVPRGHSTTALTVKSPSRGASDVQIRVYAWREGTSPTQLYRTDAVRLSPPRFRLSGRQEQTIRFERRRASRGRDCYRVLVDRLPDRRAAAGKVAIRIRHSVPLCFSAR